MRQFLVLAALVCLVECRAGAIDHSLSEDDDREVVSLTDLVTNNPQLKTIDGEDIYDGDIVLVRDEMNRQAQSNLWPGGKIKYTIEPSLRQHKKVLMEAINQWRTDTCLTFQEVPNSYKTETHMRFHQGSGCSSVVGFHAFLKDRHKVSIGNGCQYKGIIMHEIGHTLGLRHQHQRIDRDNFLTIMLQNVQSGVENNFTPSDGRSSNFSVPYDYSSIMHYRSTAFSKNGKPTMMPKQKKYKAIMGDRKGLSHRDKKIVNLMYKCGAKCSGSCKNEGYMDKKCKCVCPPGITGSKCQTRPPGYNYYNKACNGRCKRDPPFSDAAETVEEAAEDREEAEDEQIGEQDQQGSIAKFGAVLTMSG